MKLDTHYIVVNIWLAVAVIADRWSVFFVAGVCVVPIIKRFLEALHDGKATGEE